MTEFSFWANYPFKNTFLQTVFFCLDLSEPLLVLSHGWCECGAGDTVLCESDMVYVGCDDGVKVSPSCCDMHLSAPTWQQPHRATAVCPTEQTPNYKHCLSHPERQSAKEMESWSWKRPRRKSGRKWDAEKDETLRLVSTACFSAGIFMIDEMMHKWITITQVIVPVLLHCCEIVTCTVCNKDTPASLCKDLS